VFDGSARNAEHFAFFFALPSLSFSSDDMHSSWCSAKNAERWANGYASRISRQAIRWSMSL
jgi:hypothetical protein